MLLQSISFTCWLDFMMTVKLYWLFVRCRKTLKCLWFQKTWSIKCVMQLSNTYASDLKVDTCWDLIVSSVFCVKTVPFETSLHQLFFSPFSCLIKLLTQNLMCGSPDSPVVRRHGEGLAWSQAGRGLYSTQEGGCHERRPEGGWRDGRHARTGGWLLHPIWRLQLSQDSSQVRDWGLKCPDRAEWG